MVDLQPPPPTRRHRLTVFLPPDLFAEIFALSKTRRQKPGRVASVIVESFLRARLQERDVGGGPPEEVVAGGA